MTIPKYINVDEYIKIYQFRGIYRKYINIDESIKIYHYNEYIKIENEIRFPCG